MTDLLMVYITCDSVKQAKEIGRHHRHAGRPRR